MPVFVQTKKWTLRSQHPHLAQLDRPHPIWHEPGNSTVEVLPNGTLFSLHLEKVHICH